MRGHEDQDELAILQELRDLKQKHSVDRDGELEGKDLAAHRALALYGELIRDADWALHHLVGLGMAGRRNIPPLVQITTARDTPGYSNELNEVESHKWENAGAELFRQGDHPQHLGIPAPDRSIDDPNLLRMTLENVATPLLSKLFPAPLAARFKDALAIANHGGHTELFGMDQTSRSYELKRLKLRAVEHRAYRSARWRDREKTREVAEEFDVTNNRIMHWSKELRKGIGIEAWIALAYIALAKKAAAEDRLIDLGRSEERQPVPRYSDEKLQRDARRFRNLKVERQSPE